MAAPSEIGFDVLGLCEVHHESRVTNFTHRQLFVMTDSTNCFLILTGTLATFHAREDMMTFLEGME